jgi:hypothetical protein
MGAQLPACSQWKKDQPALPAGKRTGCSSEPVTYSGDQERSVQVSLWMMLPSLYDQVIVS